MRSTYLNLHSDADVDALLFEALGPEPVDEIQGEIGTPSAEYPHITFLYGGGRKINPDFHVWFMEQMYGDWLPSKVEESCQRCDEPGCEECGYVDAIMLDYVATNVCGVCCTLEVGSGQGPRRLRKYPLICQRHLKEFMVWRNRRQRTAKKAELGAAKTARREAREAKKAAAELDVVAELTELLDAIDAIDEAEVELINETATPLSEVAAEAAIANEAINVATATTHWSARDMSYDIVDTDTASHDVSVDVWTAYRHADGRIEFTDAYGYDIVIKDDTVAVYRQGEYQDRRTTRTTDIYNRGKLPMPSHIVEVSVEPTIIEITPAAACAAYCECEYETVVGDLCNAVTDARFTAYLADPAIYDPAEVRRNVEYGADLIRAAVSPISGKQVASFCKPLIHWLTEAKLLRKELDELAAKCDTNIANGTAPPAHIIIAPETEFGFRDPKTAEADPDREFGFTNPGSAEADPIYRSPTLLERIMERPYIPPLAKTNAQVVDEMWTAFADPNRHVGTWKVDVPLRPEQPVREIGDHVLDLLDANKPPEVTAESLLNEIVPPNLRLV